MGGGGGCLFVSWCFIVCGFFFFFFFFFFWGGGGGGGGPVRTLCICTVSSFSWKNRADQLPSKQRLLTCLPFLSAAAGSSMAIPAPITVVCRRKTVHFHV